VGLPIDFLPAERVAHNARLPDLVRLARGESVIKCPSPLNVLNYTHGHST
jgi:hypothetical protein